MNVELTTRVAVVSLLPRAASEIRAATRSR
jgi:hypothetical protein